MGEALGSICYCKLGLDNDIDVVPVPEHPSLFWVLAVYGDWKAILEKVW
jgi:hypothetical protein